MDLLEALLRRREGDAAFVPFDDRERADVERLTFVARRLDTKPPVLNQELYWSLAACFVFMSWDRAEPGEDFNTLDCARLYWTRSAAPGWLSVHDGGLRHDDPALRAARRRRARARDALDEGDEGDAKARAACWRATAALKVARRAAWTPEPPQDAFPLERFHQRVLAMAWRPAA